MEKANYKPSGRLRDGSTAQYMGVCPVTGKHRVMTGHEKSGTVWLLDDYGRARGEGQTSPKDWIGPA
jgi:hypothetical protein